MRVSEHKRGRIDPSRNRDGKPRVGTKLRKAYDALRTGGIVTIGNSGISVQLRDFYGMDIETVKSHSGRVIGSRLVGEWDGPYYVPVERIVSL